MQILKIKYLIDSLFKMIKQSVLLFAILIFLPIEIFSQPNLNQTVKRGLEYEFNFNWNKAEAVFKGMIKKYPEDPRGFHYQAGIYLWYYLSNHDIQSYKNFVEYSDSAIDKARDFLNKKPDNIEMLYVLGSDYSYRTIAFAKAEKFLDAVWASKKSESYLSRTLQLDPAFYDAYLGLGLYNFGVGQIPSAFRWALSLAGIHGNKETGLKYIWKAAKNGDLSKIEAEYYLSQILTDYYFDYQSAAHLLQNLVELYPRNILFSYSLAALDIKRRKLDDAGNLLEKVLKSKDSNFSQIISFSNFLMGDVNFKENHFKAAESYYRIFLSSARDSDYKGIAYYRLAVSCEITGDKKDAVKYFEMTGNGNMDIEDDIYAKRQGEIYSKRTLASAEIDLIKYSNLIDDGKYKTASDSLFDLLGRVKTDRMKAEVSLNLSEAYFLLGKYHESLSYALTSKALDSSTEKWIEPYSCFYAARAEAKLGNKEAVKSYIDEAKSFSDFDYQKKLENLIFALTSSES